MQRDTKYHRNYVSFMNEVIRKSYARKISEKAVNSAPGKVWYIQHHSIYYTRKPGKVRVVFDCSVKYLGTSLNEQLLQGPDLTNSLIGVLTRFRQEPVAFMADIEVCSTKCGFQTSSGTTLDFSSGQMVIYTQKYRNIR